MWTWIISLFAALGAALREAWPAIVESLKQTQNVEQLGGDKDLKEHIDADITTRIDDSNHDELDGV